MIYRKWSLLTGPTSILGGIVATLAIGNYIFVENDPFLKPHKKKQEAHHRPSEAKDGSIPRAAKTEA